MVPGHISKKIVAAKCETVSEMLAGVHSLPLSTFEEFTRDPRMVAAGESYLRRALEAMLDLGRHVLAKGFGLPVPEYAAIAEQLGRLGLLSSDSAADLKRMAGYRNRMVHEYDVVTPPELYKILSGQMIEIEDVVNSIRSWLSGHPDRMDDRL
jgi:uncharacterized protein YutE (UPF0331/DUF86 family)